MDNIQPQHQAAEVFKLNWDPNFFVGRASTMVGRTTSIPKGTSSRGSLATSTHKNIHERNNLRELIRLPTAHRNTGDDNKHHPAENYYQQPTTTSPGTTTTTSGSAQRGSTRTSNTGSKHRGAISQNNWGQQHAAVTNRSSYPEATHLTYEDNMEGPYAKTTALYY